MKESRKRKNRSSKGSLSTSRSRYKRDGGTIDEKSKSSPTWRYLSVGILLAVCLSYVYFQHTHLLHENELWFSHIDVSSIPFPDCIGFWELEREISFRTEAALYYSYYKEVVLAPSILKGLASLVHDNLTESGHSINAIHRFNIFQEIILAVLYRLTPFQSHVEAITFYVNNVFILQGIYALALYCTAWILSDSFMGGALAFAFFFFNRIDATRVEYAVALRESFALPFIVLQLFFITVYLRVSLSHKRWSQVLLVFFFINSSVIALTWQFAQFIFLLEVCALIVLYTTRLSSQRKTMSLMLCYAGVLLMVFVVQFFNVILLTSLTFAISTATIVVFTLQTAFVRKSASFLVRLLCIPSLFPIAVIGMAICINLLIKRFIAANDNDHIFNFILAKLGLHNPRDFDVLLYLCQPAFQHVSRDTLFRLASSLLLPCYLFIVSVLATQMMHHVWRVLARSYSNLYMDDHFSSAPPENDSNSGHISSHELQDKLKPDACMPNPPTELISPEFAYHLLLSVAFGSVAVTTQRFKVLWVPHMCVLTAGTLANLTRWRAILKRIGAIKNNHADQIFQFIGISTLITALVVKDLPAVLTELRELRVFHDPDTVELMQWIGSNTSRGAVFAGSMQLLAGVKLCTGRSITNHPHFENKELRERTLQVYQMYGKWTPEEVYNSLNHYGTNYIIIESSICFARPNNSTSQNCRLVDILDQVHRGKKTEVRFCKGVQHLTEYRKHFKVVFKNNTFQVYQLL